jgi:hypothetical protein
VHGVFGKRFGRHARCRGSGVAGGCGIRADRSMWNRSGDGALQDRSRKAILQPMFLA